MIKRTATEKLNLLASEYGVISVTGPRQSGKTTLVRSNFPDHKYYNLELLNDLDKIKSDPISFIKNADGGIILDEVQKYPDILSYIQVALDENFHLAKYVIIGSQNLLLSDKIAQSLAGRVGILTLLPLSISELTRADQSWQSHHELLLKGFYPSIYDKQQTPSLYYANYLNTYVQRDVRSLRNIGDLSAFNKFLQLLAGRIGQLLNLSELGGVVGASHKTIESWISVLEASYIVFRLEPYFVNFGKRLIKSPKIYFTDVGLATHLLRLDTIDEIENHFALGNLFENMVIADIVKAIKNSLSSDKIYFFRDNKGLEIDLIIDQGSEIIPIEIKSSATFSSDFISSLKKFQKFSNTQQGSLIYTGEGGEKIKGITLHNYHHLSDLSAL